MPLLLILSLCAAAGITGFVIVRKKQKPEDTPVVVKDITEMYVPITILTDREYEFYKKLRPVAEKYGLQIFMKIRLADLVEAKPKNENPMWQECFNKIKAKHIDFALADKYTNIVVLIELDDRTHDRQDRIDRDKFVNAVLKNCGYTLLRTYGGVSSIDKAVSKILSQDQS